MQHAVLTSTRLCSIKSLSFCLTIARFKHNGANACYKDSHEVLINIKSPFSNVSFSICTRDN